MYRYLFYRLFLLTRSWTREEEQPEWGAASGITCLIILNAITVAMAAELIAGLQLALAALGAIAGAAALAINYSLFIHGGHGKAIIQEFDQETPESQRGKTVLVCFHVLGSVGAFVGMAMAL